MTGGAGQERLAGTGQLIRLALRRDRILLPGWAVIFVAMPALSAQATIDLYPSVPSRVLAASTVNATPALVAMYGRVVDPSSIGALAMWKLGGMGAAMIAILSAILVVRHSRAEEASGRLELLGATVVGRRAPLAAAMAVAAGTGLGIGVLTAAALVGAGLPVAGSVAFGAGWASVGVVFAGVAAVTAQLTASPRAATGLVAAALGVAYVLRAAGDSAPATGPTWLSWLSPVGWAQQLRPFAGERWWVLLLPAVAAAGLLLLAVAINAWRDFGTGILAERTGPARAGRGLAGPFTLAWRLQRGALLGWSLGFATLGAMVGSIATSVGDLAGNAQMEQLLARLGGAGVLTDAFLGAELAIGGIVIAAYAVGTTARLRTEEAELRAEPVLAAAVGRYRWMLGHLGLAVAGSALLATLLGASIGLGYGSRTGEVAHQVGRLTVGAAVQLPAVWVLAGVTAALFGLVPRWTAGGWVALVLALVLTELGPLLRLPEWLLALSPFSHLPKVPAAPVTAAPLLALGAVAAALVAVGLLAFRRRDLR